jgi:hypothetical protein
MVSGLAACPIGSLVVPALPARAADQTPFVCKQGVVGQGQTDLSGAYGQVVQPTPVGLNRLYAGLLTTGADLADPPKPRRVDRPRGMSGIPVDLRSRP